MERRPKKKYDMIFKRGLFGERKPLGERREKRESDGGPMLSCPLCRCV
jgi:hypothetical protein